VPQSAVLRSDEIGLKEASLGKRPAQGGPGTSAIQMLKIQSLKGHSLHGSSDQGTTFASGPYVSATYSSERTYSKPALNHASPAQVSQEGNYLEGTPLKNSQANIERGSPREELGQLKGNGASIQEAPAQPSNIAQKNSSPAEVKEGVRRWAEEQLKGPGVQSRPGPLLALAALSDTSLVVVVSEAGGVYLSDQERSITVRIGQLSKGGLRPVKKREKAEPAQSNKAGALALDAAALSPEKGLVAYWAGGVLSVADITSGALIGTQTQIQTRLTAVAFQPGAEALLAAGADGKVYRWKFHEQDGELNPERYFGPATVVSSVVGYPGGRLFFSGDWTGSLRAWLCYDADVHGGSYDENIFRGGVFAEHTATKKADRADTISISQVLVTPDGSAVFAFLQDGRIEWWMTRGLKKIGEVAAHKGEIYAAAISSDGSRLASVGRDGKVKVFELQCTEGTPLVGSFTGVVDRPSADGRFITFISDKTLTLGALDGSLLSFKF